MAGDWWSTICRMRTTVQDYLRPEARSIAHRLRSGHRLLRENPGQPEGVMQVLSHRLYLITARLKMARLQVRGYLC